MWWCHRNHERIGPNRTRGVDVVELGQIRRKTLGIVNIEWAKLGHSRQIGIGKLGKVQEKEVLRGLGKVRVSSPAITLC